MTNNEEKQHDIAISFLAEDEGLATNIHDQLSEQLNVFVYSKKQETIAGTDGMESFRNIFRHDSVLNVILHREGWGKTPWTRVEHTAIQERALADGWSTLFIIMLDNSPPPKWLPDSHIRFNFDEFGLEQVVGVLKLRLKDAGGNFRPVNILEKAKNTEHRIQFYAKRDRLFLSQEGVKLLSEGVAQVFDLIERHIQEINQSTSMTARLGRRNDLLAVTNGRIGIKVSWHPDALNRIGTNPLLLEEYNHELVLPGEENIKYYRRAPEAILSVKFKHKLNMDFTWSWERVGALKHTITAEKVADECVDHFLKLVDKAASGKLPEPSY